MAGLGVISPGETISKLGEVADALLETNKFDMVDLQPALDVGAGAS